MSSDVDGTAVENVPERYVGRGETMNVALAVRHFTVSRGTLTTFAFMWEAKGETPGEDIPGFTDVYLWSQHTGTSLALTLSRANLLEVGQPFRLERAPEEENDGWKVVDADGDVWRA